jgi:predicted O-linked N-acetylglucosamine transferase (SPINDLY family)
LDEALAGYDKALSLKPDYAQVWSNKAVTLNELKRFDEALAAYDKALSLDPNAAQAWSNKAITLNELKRFDESVNHFEKALSIQNDYKPIDWAYGHLIHTKMKINHWAGFAKDLGAMAEQVSRGLKSINPFALLALNDDPIVHQKAAQIYAQAKCPSNSELGPLTSNSQKGKIRIGYYSADFKNHAVSILIPELLELHHRDQFEIIAFSFGVDDKSLVRERIAKAVDQFVDVCRLSDPEIARLSREMQIDIAIDLGGYTADSRTGIFACRAAPIQMSYLGYLGTMGVSYFDYLIADRTIIPEGSEHFYTEKIIYLPSYQVNDRKRQISDKQFTRSELGLPEEGFVFLLL